MAKDDMESGDGEGYGECGWNLLTGEMAINGKLCCCSGIIVK